MPFLKIYRVFDPMWTMSLCDTAIY